MAETSKIAEIAELMSNRCFGQFGWELLGPRDQNWNCVEHERHQLATHPSDCVFRYQDPLAIDGARNTYVLFDLKSYGNTSIRPDRMAGAVKRLCMATECANHSPGFAELYGSTDDGPNEVVGALFVYNHDADYAGDFSGGLRRVLKEDLWRLRKGRRVYAISPANVLHIYRIAVDLMIMASTGNVGALQDRRFFYPDLVTRRARFSDAKCASLDSLLGDWIIVEDGNPEDPTGRRYVVYARGSGESLDEFEYLLDMLFRFQLVRPQNRIRLKLPGAARTASAAFARAVQAYRRQLHDLEEVRDRLAVVTYESMTATVPVFSEVELGFD